MTADGAARDETPRSQFGRPSPAWSAEPALPSSGGASGGAWRPGWRADGGSSPWFALRAAAAVGVRHRLAGRGCDDAYAWGWTGERLVVAIADGVGSIAGSAGAAERAVATAVSGWNDPAEAIAAANTAVSGTGATTLVVAHLQASGQLSVARVGDSSAFMIDPAGGALELFTPPDPDRLGEATDALPAPDPPTEEWQGTLFPGSVLVLATDGLAGPWRDGPTTVGPALSSELSGMPSPVELLRLIDFSRQGCHDDRAVLCVRLREAG